MYFQVPGSGELTARNLLICASESFEAPEAYLLHTGGVHWVRLDWLPQLESFICSSTAEPAAGLPDPLASTCITRLISRYTDDHDQETSPVQGLAICADVFVGHHAIALVGSSLIIHSLDVLPRSVNQQLSSDSSTQDEQLADLEFAGMPSLVSPLTSLIDKYRLVPRYAVPNQPPDDLRRLRFLADEAKKLSDQHVSYLENLGLHAIRRYEAVPSASASASALYRPPGSLTRRHAR